jgi:hypothetical protein
MQSLDLLKYFGNSVRGVTIKNRIGGNILQFILSGIEELYNTFGAALIQDEASESILFRMWREVPADHLLPFTTSRLRLLE